jgi:hypothetical protein
VKPSYVAGLGFWAPGLSGPRALVSDSIDSAVVEPACALLPSRLARRTSILTRMLIEVVAQAGATAQVDLASVPTVFATAYGEIETLHSLLAMLGEDGELSPTKFHNSVYNTASGYFSIAALNKAFTTTVAAGAETVALALLEGMCVLEERGGAVIVAFADEASTLPLRVNGAQSLAAAVCLTAERPAGGGFGRLAAPRWASPATLPKVPEPFRSNPIAPAWPLVRALQQQETGVLPLSHGERGGWLVELLPAGAEL